LASWSLFSKEEIFLGFAAHRPTLLFSRYYWLYYWE